MSDAPTAAARRVGSGTSRLVRAWRALPHESQLAAFASVGLFLTLFLPWYQVTLIARGQSAALQSASATITGWGAFSFVEAAVLLVAASVLVLLFQRAEGRAFHLPGGDGGVITAAGVWTCVLIIWRIFDKQGATATGPSATSSGVEWGIFVALTAGAFLTYSGSRIRAAHRPEPPLPGEDHAPAGSNAAADTTTEPRHPRERRSEPRRSEPRRSEPRRRARTPRPVSADRPASPADRPVSPADRPVSPADRRAAEPARRRPAVIPDTSTGTPTVRSRRRVSAEELFERVVPEDPPVMRFGRITPSSRPSLRPSAEPTSDDDQLTTPSRDDATARLGEDKTLPLGADDTLVLGGDDTMRLGTDDTAALGADDTLPLGADDTLPLPLRRRPEH
jgi:hypothetical protein